MMMKRLSWAAVALALAQVVVGAGLSLADNPEGPAGGVLYALFYAAPLLLIAGGLRSPRPSLHAVAAWVAIILAFFYTVVVVGNWPGYSGFQRIFVVSITAPTVALYAVIFWAAIFHQVKREDD
jgi:hypothetical protein